MEHKTGNLNKHSSVRKRYDFKYLIILTILTLCTDQEKEPNPNNAILIRNEHPNTWIGRECNIGIYKDNRLFVAQKSVNVGDQIDFELHSKLFFGVVHNFEAGNVFTSLEITSALAEFDLSNYPNGMIVTLDQSPGGGTYTFSAKELHV